VVFQADAVQWLQQNPLAPGTSVITSLPDSSEVSSLSFPAWRQWFSDTCELICRKLPDDGVAIFFQTDVKVDKGFLVQRGAEAAGVAQLWHKVVCRAPAGTITFGRPAYAHLLCFSKSLRLLKGQSTADVLPRLGEMTWARAMGVEACLMACTFVRDLAKSHTVLDPFCGVGSALAVANQLGLEAIGVELSAKRAQKARELQIRLGEPQMQRNPRALNKSSP
jgi:hypothetical protein